MNSAIIEIQYFPPVSYFTVMVKYDTLIIESCENYQKQSYRNRCRILTSNKIDDLTIPVIKGNSKAGIRNIKIDNKQKWIYRHWRAIKSAYGKAPFFEHYEDSIHRLIARDHKFLFDKNLAILHEIFTYLGMDPDLQFTDTFERNIFDKADDLRNSIHPKSEPDYPSFFKPEKYIQLFGNTFFANLSILDLLFCEGPNAAHIVHSCIKS